MRWLEILRTRLRLFFRRSRESQRLDAELQDHLDRQIAENVSAGMSAEEARYAALRAFGNPALLRDQVHAAWSWNGLESILRDVRYAMRQLRRTPGFTAVALLTLALGIGATTAIFTLVRAVLLKSLPVTKPGELYRVGDVERCCVYDGLQNDWSVFSYDQYRAFRQNTPEFSQLAAFQAGRDLIGVRRSGATEPASAYHSEFVSGNAFQTLGVGAYLGRVLLPADDRQEAPPTAMMSYRLWQSKYGSDRAVVGSVFVLNSQPFTIVGIAPPGFFGESLQSGPPDFWIPLSCEPLLDSPAPFLNMTQVFWLNLIGRLAPAASPDTAQNRLRQELQQWLQTPASHLGTQAHALIPRQTLRLSYGGSGIQQMRKNYTAGLRLLFWLSGFVLLIACGNIANLLLARATTHRRQTSVRSALGASRSRLMRQALTESLLLALLGGLAGLAFAYGCASLIVHLAFRAEYVPISPSPSLPVLGFAFAASLLTSILFGMAPAWIAAHADPIEALRGSSRSSAGGVAVMQKVLVIVQTASSFVLLCLAGLLMQSLYNVHRLNLGFATANRYVVLIEPQMAGYKPGQLNLLYRSLADALEQVPGIEDVSYALNTPMGKNPWSNGVFILGESPQAQEDGRHQAQNNRVGPGYFQAIGTPILQGRPITEDDTAASRHVAVVNQAFARRFFKNQNAIGKHFGRMEAQDAGNYEIVGVAEDAQYLSPTAEMEPMFFLPEAQSSRYWNSEEASAESLGHYLPYIVLRSAAPAASLEPEVQRQLAGISPNLPIIRFMSLGEQVDESLEQQSMIAQLTSLFGLLALVLAAVGLYGVTACSVEHRTNEIGIRMALGADRASVIGAILRGAFLEVVAGLAIGLPAIALGGRLIASQLFGVQPYNPAILALATALLFCAALIAAVVPARRASSIDPMQALRTE